MVNVLGAVAQWEREATAERTSAALQVLKAQGRATGGVAPYGFQFIHGRREWHQGEQETLAAIIEHRRASLSWAKVADKLNATEHRTRTGGQWTRGPLSARQAPAHPRQDRSHCPLMLARSLSRSRWARHAAHAPSCAAAKSGAQRHRYSVRRLTPTAATTSCRYSGGPGRSGAINARASQRRGDQPNR